MGHFFRTPDGASFSNEITWKYNQQLLLVQIHSDRSVLSALEMEWNIFNQWKIFDFEHAKNELSTLKANFFSLH